VSACDRRYLTDDEVESRAMEITDDVDSMIGNCAGARTVMMMIASMPTCTTTSPRPMASQTPSVAGAGTEDGVAPKNYSQRMSGRLGGFVTAVRHLAGTRSTTQTMSIPAGNSVSDRHKAAAETRAKSSSHPPIRMLENFSPISRLPVS